MKKLFVALLILILFTQCTTPQFRLVGPKVFTLEADDKFVDPGVSSIDHQIPQTIISSDLNTHLPGDYEIRYTLMENGKAGTQLIRKVHVVDTTSPIITLIGAKSVDVCPNTQYIDEGVSAFDKVDGDLTNKISISATQDVIEYTITDNAGNSATAVRQLLYRDVQAPMIQDAKEISVLQGASLASLNAKDNCEGDVSYRIVANKQIDTQIPGDYTLTFDVSDSAGNKSTFTQIIHVVKARGLTTLYFTFDDGPSSLTDDFLDVLKEFNVKATFFVNNRSSYSDMVKRAFAEGHTIAMHSASHSYHGIYSSEDAFYKDLYVNQAWIKSLTGFTSNLYRFPGGSSNAISDFNPGIMTTLTQSIRSKGIQYVDWNLSSGDGSRNTAAFLVANVKRQLGTRSSYVILMHDSAGHATTLTALREILIYATGLGYTIKPLSYTSPSAHHSVKN